MGPRRIAWQEKVSRLLAERKWSAAYLARRMGMRTARDGRTLRTWLGGTRRPIGETTIIAQLAVALEVPEEWLRDGREGPPPKRGALAVPDEVIRAVPERFRRLAYAIGDDETAEHLLACLDLYERAQRRGRTGT